VAKLERTRRVDARVRDVAECLVQPRALEQRGEVVGVDKLGECSAV